MSEKQAGVNVWVITYALTSGIRELVARDILNGYAIAGSGAGLRAFRIGSEAFYTQVEANKAAAAKALRALKSLEKKRSKLEALAKSYGVEP
jgi:hypothetical protein